MIRRIGLALSLVSLLGSCALVAPEEKPPLDVEVDHVIGDAPRGTPSARGPSPGILREAWRTELTMDDVGGQAGSALLVGDGRLLAVAPHGVTALDAATGEEEWHYREPGRDTEGFAVTGGAVVVSTDGGDGGRVVGFETGTGRLLWQRSLDVGGQDVLRYGALRSGGGLSAGKGVLLTQRGEEQDVRIAGVDVRTGKDRWTADLTAQPGCLLRLPLMEGMSDGSLALVAEHCRGDTLRVHALDPATGQVRWTHEQPSESTYQLTASVARGVTVFARDDMATFIGPDGRKWADPVVPCVPCRPITVGEELLLPSLKTGEESWFTLVNTTSGQARQIPATENHVSWISATDRVYASVTALTRTEIGLPRFWVAVVDPVTGTAKGMPLQTAVEPEGRAVVVGAVDGRLLVAAGSSVRATVTVIAYDSVPTTGPVEFGGVRPEEWPGCRTLLRGVRGVSAARTMHTNPYVQFGTEKRFRTTCTFTVGDEGDADDVDVDVIWVAATAKDADRLLDGERGSPSGADEVYRAEDSWVLRVGRYIIEVSGDVDVSAPVVAAVVRNLRAKG